LWADLRLHSNRPELSPQAAVKELMALRGAVMAALVAVRLMAVLVEQDKPEEVGIRHRPPRLKVTMVEALSRRAQQQMAVAAAGQVL
jgi:hypothetical protein